MTNAPLTAADPAFWTPGKLDEISQLGDPETDQLVLDYLHRIGSTPKAAIRTVASHHTLPPEEQTPEIAAYLADRPPLPPWADDDAIERCERLFGVDGPALGWAMVCSSFPASYASAHGARILTYTARLSAQPKRRILETTQLVWDCFQPRGLHVGGPGWTTTRRVRLMHATARALVAAHAGDPHPIDHRPVWDHAWGSPINQMEMTAFIMPMTLTQFDTLPHLGIELTDAQKRDLLHTWCVIAHVMGVQDDLLPFSLESAEVFWKLVQDREYAPSADGVELMKAHDEMVCAMLPKVLNGLPETIQRLALGDPLCDQLGIDRANWTRHLVSVMEKVTSKLWMAEQHDAALRRVADFVGRRAIHDVLSFERGKDDSTFSIPDELSAVWESKRSQRKPPGRR
jgi:ER-bound oxygenase mpaB/B'/Rubber oxygenase, catalytic domain